MRYRLLIPRWARFESGRHCEYREGDVLDLSSDELQSLKFSVVPVDEPASAPAEEVTFRVMPAEVSTDTVDAAEVEKVSPASLPWREAVAAIEEMDDAESVFSALEGEEAGKARKSVLAACEEKLAELEVE